MLQATKSQSPLAEVMQWQTGNPFPNEPIAASPLAAGLFILP